MVDVGTKKDGESFVAQKQKESTQKAMRTLTEQNKKEVAKVAEKNARMEKECTAKEKAEQEQNDVKESRKSSSHHTDEQELLEQGGGDTEEKRTPFILKRHTKEQTGGQQKKNKSDKQSHIDPMLLTEGDLDLIEDMITETMTEVLQQFEQQYMQMMGSIQKDLHEQKIQENKIRVGVG